ncbi:hypothetical protein [Patiriisocius marinus]|uniref:hypothetical protein n=1 Tax=Patiriisocius marinus TaxID=1397112 RepID=UPI00232EB83E|nr:hypothetical protein [Patiriisocius marinus]
MAEDKKEIKQVPRWLYEDVKRINLRLIDECGMSWDDILDFWQDLINTSKNESN